MTDRAGLIEGLTVLAMLVTGVFMADKTLAYIAVGYMVGRQMPTPRRRR